ncbi:hypothetical protein C8J56DRAFT_769407, partial [Mycena floridula]
HLSPSIMIFGALIAVNLSFLAASAAVTQTIDDAAPQFTYSPAARWAAGPCDGCAANVDPSQAFDGTWRDCSSGTDGVEVTATVQFAGTSVAVYGILAGGQDVPTFLTFSLDSQHKGNFSWKSPPGLGGFQYGQRFLSLSGLDPVTHTLVIRNGNTTNSSFVLLDYIAYT